MRIFSELCTPAKVYVVLTSFTIIIMLFSENYSAAFTKIIFAGLFTFLLNWFCKKGMTGLSWFLVLLPFILIFLTATYMTIMLTKKQHKINKANENNEDVYFNGF